MAVKSKNKVYKTRKEEIQDVIRCFMPKNEWFKSKDVSNFFHRKFTPRMLCGILLTMPDIKVSRKSDVRYMLVKKK